MDYTLDDLNYKILEMYPEVSKHGISVSLEFNTQKNPYIIKFTTDKH